MKRGDPTKPCVICGVGKQRAWAASCSPECGRLARNAASDKFMREPAKQRGYKVWCETAAVMEAFKEQGQ